MVRSTKILPSATTSIQIWQVCRIFLSTSLRYLLALYFPRLAWSFQRSRLLSCWEQERSQGIVKRETWNAARAQRSKASQNLREFNALQTISITGDKLAQMRHCKLWSGSPPDFYQQVGWATWLRHCSQPKTNIQRKWKWSSNIFSNQLSVVCIISGWTMLARFK